MSIERELIMTARSPFARRIRIALYRLNLEFRETIIDAFHPPAWLPEINPLALIPVLKVTQRVGATETTEAWIDSSMILENLHDETGRVWATQSKIRRREREISTWAAGIMQLTVQIFLESKKASPDAESLAEWKTNILNTLKALEPEIAPMLTRELKSSMATLTQPLCDAVVAYDYLKLRLSELDLSVEAPELTNLANAVSLHDWFQKTKPPV